MLSTVSGERYLQKVNISTVKYLFKIDGMNCSLEVQLCLTYRGSLNTYVTEV